MAYNLKKELEKPERLAGGHRLCAGCGAGIAVRGVLRALEPEDKAVITNATGCLKYPRLFIHIQHITTATSTRLSPMRRRLAPVLKLPIMF